MARLLQQQQQQVARLADTSIPGDLRGLLLQPVLAAACALAAADENSSSRSNSSRNAIVVLALLLEAVDGGAAALLDVAAAAAAADDDSSSSSSSRKAASMIPLLLEAVTSGAVALSSSSSSSKSSSQPFLPPLLLQMIEETVRKLLGKSDELQLSADTQASVLSAALQMIAAAAGKKGSSSWSEEQQTFFLWLWSKLVAVAADCKQQALTSGAAEALLTAPGVTKQLLQPGLPVLLLQGLLQGAVAVNSADATQQIVLYATDQGMLELMPGELVGQVTSLRGAKVGWDSQLQLLSTSLGQGQALSRKSTAALLEGFSAAAKKVEGEGGEVLWQQLLSVLREKCLTAPAAAAYGSLCLLIEAGEGKLQRQRQWQLYELLLECQAAKGWGREHMGLTAAACDALIKQQNKGAARSIVQVWRHYARGLPAAAAGRLQQGAQVGLLRALVRSGEAQAAFEVVQQVPTLLPNLVEQWQKLGDTGDNTGDTTGSRLLLEALQLAVQQGTSSAAAAAEGVLSIVAAKGMQRELWEARGVMAAVLGLLCVQEREKTARRWIKERLAASEGAAVGGAARAIFAEAMQNSRKQQQLIAGLLAEVLSAGNYGSMLSVLEAAQHEDLVLMCCTNHSSGSSSSQGAGSNKLPSRVHLAEEVLATSLKLPSKAAAALVNAVAQSEGLLQPSVAAVLLGEVTEQQLAAAAASSTSSSTTGSTRAAAAVAVGAMGGAAGGGKTAVGAKGVDACRAASRFLADLCYVQLGCTADVGADAEAAESGMDWAYSLSNPAAAAALFATWYWSQPSRAMEASAAAGVAAAGQKPPPPRHSSPVPPSLAACGMLGEVLYSTARQGLAEKPGLDSCLLDLALMAAAAAGDWDKGGWWGLCFSLP